MLLLIIDHKNCLIPNDNNYYFKIICSSYCASREHEVISLYPCVCRIKAVNESILSHFSVDLHIDQHFEALQQFLLLSDGEFSVSLTDQLFDKVTEEIMSSCAVLIPLSMHVT